MNEPEKDETFLILIFSFVLRLPTADAYFENPNDWAFQRVQEERGGYKRDYGAPLDPKQVALTLVWGGGISAYILYLVYSLGSGKWCGYVILLEICAQEVCFTLGSNVCWMLLSCSLHPDANFCKVFFS